MCTPIREAIFVAPLYAILIAFVLWPMIGHPDEAAFAGTNDAWLEAGPNAFYFDYSIHELGEFPLWNPLTYCGQPFLGIHGTFYPPNLIRSGLNADPTPHSTHASMLVMMCLHLLMGTLAMHGLARCRGLSFGAAVLAAGVFLLAAPMVYGMTQHFALVNTMCWWPVATLLAQNAVDRESVRMRVCAAIGAGWAWGCAILLGAPQFFLLMGFGLAVWTFACGSISGDRAIGLRRAFIALAIIAVVGAAIGAPLVLPVHELSGMSPRASSSEIEASVLPTEQSWASVYELFTSYTVDSERSYFHLAGVWISALALLALARWRDKKLYPPLFLAYAMIDCALGPPMPMASLFQWVAPMQIVVPARAALLSTLPLGLLAGLGFEHIMASQRTRRGAVATVATIIVLALIDLSANRVNLIVNHSVSPERFIPFTGAAVVVAMILACFIRPRYGKVAVTGVILLDLAVVGQAFFNYHLHHHLPLPSVEHLRAPEAFWSDNRRVSHEYGNSKMYALQGVMTGYIPLYNAHQFAALCGEGRENEYSAFLGRDVPTENRRGQLLLKRPFWLVSGVVDGALPPKKTLFPPTQVAYVPGYGEGPLASGPADDVFPHAVSPDAKRVPFIDQETLEEMTTETTERAGVITSSRGFDHVFQREPGHAAMYLRVGYVGDVIVEAALHNPNKERLERAQLLYTFHLSSDVYGEATLEYPLPDMDTFKLRIKTTVTEPASKLDVLGAEVAVDPADEDKNIRILSRTANTAEVAVNCVEGPRLLLYTDAMYPGWRASIDGATAPLLKANDVFKAVEVPQGEHTIRFEFAPKRPWVGVAIALTTLLCTSILVVSLVIRDRRPAR